MPSSRESLPQETPHQRDRTLNPLFTLQVPSDVVGGKHPVLGSGTPSSVASVCFLPNNLRDRLKDTRYFESDSSSDDEDPVFRCRAMTLAEKKSANDAMAQAREAAASLSLTGTFLASCHSNGDSFLWDLGRRRIVSEFTSARGPALVLRRMGEGRKILYQTRDADGTVSIHACGTEARESHAFPVLAKYRTRSRTFCAASPCMGNANLVGLPSQDETCVNVRDLRISESSAPVAQFSGDGHSLGSRNKRLHGMLTSLAMSEASVSSTRPVVACGMESGSVFFHDLGMSENHFKKAAISSEVEGRQESTPISNTSVKLGKNPILGLDLATSSLPSSEGNVGSVVAIAGMAGDAADLSELPEADRGTVAVLKAVLPSQGIGSTPVARLRARLPTCKVGGDTVTGGKPGVSVCRLRPDGRIFAIGGWDKRLRLFDRASSASPLAILKAHDESVTAVDWAPDAATSGMMATGAGDGRICLWRCFPSNSSFK